MGFWICIEMVKMMDMEMVKEFNELLAGFQVSEEQLGIAETVKARFEQGVHMGTNPTTTGNVSTPT